MKYTEEKKNNQLNTLEENSPDKIITKGDQDSEQLKLMKNIYDSLPIQIFAKDLDNRLIYANKFFLKGNNKNIEQVIGKTPFDFAPHSIAELYLKADAELIKHGGVQQYQGKIVDEKGIIHDANFIKTLVLNEKNLPEAIVGAIIDITESKHEWDIMLRQKWWLDEVFNGVQEGIGIVDENERVIFCNPAFSDIFEETADNLIGNSIIPFFDESSKHLIMDGNVSSKKGKQTANDVSLITMRGTRRFVKLFNSPRFGEDGKYIGAFIALMDLTDRKIAEEKMKDLIEELRKSRIAMFDDANKLVELNDKLIQSEAMLKNLNQTKDKFFSIIAHDLKNPMSAYAQMTEELTDNIDLLDKKDIFEELHKMKESSKNIFELLENLLEWSRTQTGSIKFNPDSVPLNFIIKNNISLLKLNADKKKINLTAKIDSDINVFADVNLITTVLRNLIINAIKFTHEGGEITVDVEEFDDHVIVSIIDNGIGISESDKQKLFKIDVYQTTVGTANEKGTGLGLILCKEFVEKNGGKIWVDSEIGKGSSFRFTLSKI